MVEDFVEISHSGGEIIFSIRTNTEGNTSYQITISHSRPTPVAIIGIYALPQGIPIADLQMGGIGHVPDQPPIPGCFPVYIASDSHGKFGHHCPQCDGYWRSGPFPKMCPYCANNEPSYQFLSKAQLSYVRHYCNTLSCALDTGENADVKINMDDVADAVGKEEKPAFYVSEESQQCKFTCKACGEYNDIIGRFGYCSLCGTRNDVADFENNVEQTIRAKLNSGNAPEDCVRDAVSAFDAFMAQIAKELVKLVPMTNNRKNRLTGQPFHNLDEIRDTFNNWFDIDIFAGISQAERQSTGRLFQRRHIYEHNAGVVDQNYIDKSGDTTVRLNQHIHETKEDMHSFLSSLVKMVRNTHSKFHELFPPFPEPIKFYREKTERMRNMRDA